MDDRAIARPHLVDTAVGERFLGRFVAIEMATLIVKLGDTRRIEAAET